MFNKPEEVVVEVNGTAELIAARTILEEKFERGNWGWKGYDKNYPRYLYINFGEVHTTADRMPSPITFDMLVKWDNDGFPVKAKEVGAAEAIRLLEEKFGCTVKIVK